MRAKGGVFAAVAVAAVVAVGLGGCQDHSPAAVPSIGRVAKVLEQSQISSRVDALLPTPNQFVSDVRAAQVAVNHCLKQHNLDKPFAYPSSQLLRSYATATVQDRRTYSSNWGFFNPTTTSRYGYRRAQASPVIAVQSVSGREASACFAFGNSHPDPMTLTQQSSLPDGGPVLAIKDPRVITVEKRWSACMRARGFKFATPRDSIAKFIHAAVVSATEKAVATADVACKIRTNLVGAEMAVQSAYDSLYIEAHRQQLAEYEKAYR